jgi:hypothetical protein
LKHSGRVGIDSASNVARDERRRPFLKRPNQLIVEQRLPPSPAAFYGDLLEAGSSLLGGSTAPFFTAVNSRGFI